MGDDRGAMAGFSRWPLWWRWRCVDGSAARSRTPDCSFEGSADGGLVWWVRIVVFARPVLSCRASTSSWRAMPRTPVASQSFRKDPVVVSVTNGSHVSGADRTVADRRCVSGLMGGDESALRTAFQDLHSRAWGARKRGFEATAISVSTVRRARVPHDLCLLNLAFTPQLS